MNEEHWFTDPENPFRLGCEATQRRAQGWAQGWFSTFDLHHSNPGCFNRGTSDSLDVLRKLAREGFLELKVEGCYLFRFPEDRFCLDSEGTCFMSTPSLLSCTWDPASCDLTPPIPATFCDALRPESGKEKQENPMPENDTAALRLLEAERALIAIHLQMALKRDCREDLVEAVRELATGAHTEALRRLVDVLDTAFGRLRDADHCLEGDSFQGAIDRVITTIRELNNEREMIVALLDEAGMDSMNDPVAALKAVLEDLREKKAGNTQLRDTQAEIRRAFGRTGFSANLPLVEQADRIVTALQAAEKKAMRLEAGLPVEPAPKPLTDPNTDQWRIAFVNMLKDAGVDAALSPRTVQVNGFQCLFGFGPQDDGTFALWGIGRHRVDAQRNAKATWPLSEAINEAIKIPIR